MGTYCARFWFLVSGFWFLRFCNLAPLAASPNEEEDDARVGCKLPGRRQQRIEWMTRAVVARIHDHEFPVQAVRLPESLPPFGIKLYLRIVRPGRNDDHVRRRDSLGHNAVTHEPVECDDPVRLSQAEARHPVKQPGWKRLGAEPSGGNGFVRIKIHDPVEEAAAAQLGCRGAQEDRK